MVEVQAVIRPYFLVRQEMHELYKAVRAENGTQLQLDFLRALPKEPKDVKPAASDLWEAAQWNQREGALRLSKSDPSSIDTQDSKGYTPLLICAEFGSTDVARVLIEAGSKSLDTPMVEGSNTPLLWCSQWGFADIAKLLVDAGAQSVDVPDELGTTPLVWCAQEGFADVAKVLVEGGAKSLDIPGHYGNTPLMWCAQEGFAEMAQVLVDGGALCVDTPDEDGITPLFYCGDRGFLDVALVLVRAGANLDAAMTLASERKLAGHLRFFRQLDEHLKSGKSWLT